MACLNIRCQKGSLGLKPNRPPKLIRHISNFFDISASSHPSRVTDFVVEEQTTECSLRVSLCSVYCARLKLCSLQVSSSHHSAQFNLTQPNPNLLCRTSQLASSGLANRLTILGCSIWPANVRGPTFLLQKLTLQKESCQLRSLRLERFKSKQLFKYKNTKITITLYQSIHCGQLIRMKISKIGATRLKCIKYDFHRGSAG